MNAGHAVIIRVDVNMQYEPLIETDSENTQTFSYKTGGKKWQTIAFSWGYGSQ